MFNKTPLFKFSLFKHYITFVIKSVNFEFLHLAIRCVYGKDDEFACPLLDLVLSYVHEAILFHHCKCLHSLCKL